MRSLLTAAGGRNILYSAPSLSHPFPLYTSSSLSLPLSPRTNMKKAYTQLYELNRDLMLGYTIRSNNHMELLECLRIVNQAIQKTGKLRGVCVCVCVCMHACVCVCALFVTPSLFTPSVGKPKAQMVSTCRAAIKNNDNDALIKTMMGGAS